MRSGDGIQGKDGGELMRLIDGDALEKEGWSLHRTVNMDKYTSEYQIKQIAKVPTIEPERTGKWILCSERLPEENGRYLVTRGLNACGSLWNRIYIANYSDLMGIKSVRIWWQGNVGKSDFERLDDVLAWMPLPEPYREEGGHE